MKREYKIPMSEHGFEKQNIVTLADWNGRFDTYVCQHCGLMGKRYGVADVIVTTKNTPCTGELPTKIKIIAHNLQNLGLHYGKVYTVLPQPPEEVETLRVFSESRMNTVQVFPNEYEPYHDPHDN